MADWQTWRNSYKEELGFTKDDQQKLKQWISDEIKSLTKLPGADKAETLYRALTGPVTPEVPASILQFHKEVYVVADEAAMSYFK